jgi:predicted nucleic acid-binding protein
MVGADYYDSSALVKRYLDEMGSTWVQERCNNSNRVIIIADITRVEMAAAFARKLHARRIGQEDYQEIHSKLSEDLRSRYQLVFPLPERIDEAVALASRYRLRGYDAVQLACALHANESLQTRSLPPLILVAADDALVKAAQSAGLQTENPNLHP